METLVTIAVKIPADVHITLQKLGAADDRPLTRYVARLLKAHAAQPNQ